MSNLQSLIGIEDEDEDEDEKEEEGSMNA